MRFKPIGCILLSTAVGCSGFASQWEAATIEHETKRFRTWDKSAPLGPWVGREEPGARWLYILIEPDGQDGMLAKVWTVGEHGVARKWHVPLKEDGGLLRGRAGSAELCLEPLPGAEPGWYCDYRLDERSGRQRLHPARGEQLPPSYLPPAVQTALAPLDFVVVPVLVGVIIISLMIHPRPLI